MKTPLAYLDSFSGLVPCKVISVNETECMVSVEVTANRRAYRKGEKLTQPAWRVVPRTHVFVRWGQYRIRTNYEWTKEMLKP